MNNTLEKILYDIVQMCKLNTLKSFIAIKHSSIYTLISYYDGIGAKMSPEYEGITFEFEDKIFEKKIYDAFVEEDQLCIPMEVKKYKDLFWWIFNDISIENIYLYVKKIYLPLINKKDTMGISVFITNKDISKELDSFFDDIYFELVEIIYDIKKKFEERMFINKFLNNFSRLTQAADPNIYNHTLRVADVSTLIAKALGFNQEKLNFIRNCALIFDFGKIWIPKEILYKQGPLEDDEFAEVKKHISRLDEIFAGNEFMKKYVEIAKLHHEKLDGSGYLGYREDRIPIESRILAVADIFDALIYDRPYKKAYSLEEALNELKKMANQGKLDLNIVKIASETLPSFYSGSTDLSIITLLGFGKEFSIQDFTNPSVIFNGSINEIIGNIAEIVFAYKVNLTPGQTVALSCDTGGIVETFTAKVLSSTSLGYTIFFENGKARNNKYVRIIWNRKINMKLIPQNANIESVINEQKNIFVADLNMFGGSGLIFSSSEYIASVGDNVYVNFNAYGENVMIFGVVKKVDEGFIKRFHIEYLEMGEKYMSVIFKCIFKRQIEMRTGI